MMDKKLLEGLEKLNTWLRNKNQTIEIIIIGAFAIQLNEISMLRSTEDIDSISEIKDEDLHDEIERIGKEIGLDHWLNFQSSGIPMPDGYEKRLQKYEKFSNIQALYLSKEDIILLKCSAYHIRCEYTDKDYEDLRAIGLTKLDLDKAVEFIRETNSPPDNFPDVLKKFEKELEETRKNLLRIVSCG
jgi:hypothetical protein